jgi:hypothetical protein
VPAAGSATFSESMLLEVTVRAVKTELDFSLFALN